MSKLHVLWQAYKKFSPCFQVGFNKSTFFYYMVTIWERNTNDKVCTINLPDNILFMLFFHNIYYQKHISPIQPQREISVNTQPVCVETLQVVSGYTGHIFVQVTQERSCGIHWQLHNIYKDLCYIKYYIFLWQECIVFWFRTRITMCLNVSALQKHYI